MADFKLRDARKAAGKSQIEVAVAAGVSPPTVRIFEMAPEAVFDPRVRERLIAVYERMASDVSAQGRVDVESAPRRAG